MERHRSEMLLVDFPEGAVDVDTPEDFKRFQAGPPVKPESD
jgi:GTP:adenosylcobinamide-phosphate guanylyltransferase